jgi:dimeric dUTPase (all-alpha-NTP-PPase superfamily)
VVNLTVVDGSSWGSAGNGVEKNCVRSVDMAELHAESETTTTKYWKQRNIVDARYAILFEPINEQYFILTKSLSLETIVSL